MFAVVLQIAVVICIPTTKLQVVYFAKWTDQQIEAAHNKYTFVCSAFFSQSMRATNNGDGFAEHPKLITERMSEKYCPDR